MNLEEPDPVIAFDTIVGVDKKHPLVSKMDNARFILLKAPNAKFLQKGIR